MTPFEGSKCLLLLHLGWKEDYFRLLDQAMEQEDPLSPLTLDLALCGSDTEAAINTLTFDPIIRAIPQSEPLYWLKLELYRRYKEKTLTPQYLADVWQRVFTNYDVWEDRFWFNLQYISDDLDDPDMEWLEKGGSTVLVDYYIEQLEKEIKEGEQPCF